MRIVFMQMNIQEGTPAPQLKDERVRRAIIHAIDRQAMARLLWTGTVERNTAGCCMNRSGVWAVGSHESVTAVLRI